MSLLCWTICDMIYYKKPSVLGAVNGMITGLVGITPAAGVVDGWGAIAIGFATGTIPWASMNIMGKKVAYFRKIDDVLGIFHTHCVAGFLGGMCTGLFATIEGCAAFGIANPGGAIAGNGVQVWKQFYGALFIFAWNIVWTSLILCFIKYVCRIPLRMTEAELLAGDDAIHGEAAYVLGPCEAHEHLLAGHYIKRHETQPGELSLGGVTVGLNPQLQELPEKSSGTPSNEIKHD
jgi:Amt family ammonium transporter